MSGGLLGDKVFAAMGSHKEVVLITTFAAGMIVVQQCDGVFAGVLRGMEQFNISARIEMSVKLSMVLGALIAAILTKDVLAVFATTFVVSLIGMVVKGWMASRRLEQGFLWPKWSRPEMKTAMNFGGWIWMQGLGSLIFSTADRLLVGSILGASQLAYYSIALQLAQQVQTVPAAGAQVLFPRIARATELGENPFRFAVNASLLVAAIAGLLALGLLIFGDWLLLHWIGPERAQHVGAIMPWVLFAFVLVGMPSGAHFVLMGRGYVKFLAILGLVAGLLSLGIAAISLPYMGITGAALGKIVYGCTVLLLIPKMLNVLRRKE
jgi:O-antigen/teichoic acid export membrane protein